MMTINVPERKIKTQRLKKGSSVWKTPKERKKMEKDMESKAPKVTVIIPTSNQFSKISKAYNSIWTQIGKFDHIIIADQGSMDGTHPNMFAENEKITYIYYSGVNSTEIINFALINVVQTKYVLLLDARSVLSKRYMVSLKDSLKSNRFVIGTNNGTHKMTTKKIDYRNSYTGYAFWKNDAIRAGLFDIQTGLSPALFVEKMKKIGVKPAFNDNLEIITSYTDEVKFDKKAFKNRVYNFTDYNELNLNLDPVTFIALDKQKIYLTELLEQILMPSDELIQLNAVSPATLVTKFGNAIVNSKHERIIVVKSEKDELLTYDPITNLRLLFDKHRILSTNLEPHVRCLAFHKGLYVKPQKEDLDVDGIVRFIAKKSRKPIELTNIIEHQDKVNKEQTVRSGMMVEESTGPKVNTIRKKKDRTSWTVGKKGKKVIQTKKGKTSKKPSRVRIKNYSMKWSDVRKLPRIPGIKNRKPKILFISDVQGWAWHYKSKQLKKYLSDDFQIDICWLIGPGQSRIKPRAYDLYVTFGYSYIDYLKDITPRKKITGITAHRPHSILVPQMRKAAVVHANSRMLYDELKTMHNIVYYVPNGVDEELFRPITPIPEKRPEIKNNIIVGHVGKLSAMKGQEKYIKPAIKRAGAIPLFHFNDYTNAIPIEQMPEIYQDMDVFIVASKEDGTPNPALEAAACGRPIISNRIGNMPEFIKDGWNGFLVEKEIGAYVEKIKWFRNNRKKLIEMGQNARKTIEKEWTWKIQAENYRKMFKEVLGI